ncbi:hypothetical protein BgAZ_106940 [Babesia gibsoni]|uniref:Uncharacterized protein n=1 Tax=Babesia gibsoni TaxID=33632 RepID=A0AAD8PG25_BABGI|nr:hypothetical protein BgAZ_106940 [Babesia gibsoni]
MSFHKKFIFGIVCLSLVSVAGMAAVAEIFLRGGQVVAAATWMKEQIESATASVKNFYSGILNEQHLRRAEKLQEIAAK